jgi:hypothetical protein
MGKSHKGQARDLSTREADLDRSQSSLSDIDSLAKLDTTQGGTVETGTVEDTRALLIHAVPDLKEKPSTAPIEENTVKEAGDEKPVEKAVEPDGNQKPEKEVILAQLIKVVEGIDNMNTLEEFAKEAKRKGLLMGGTTEKGWWVKPLKNSENKALVDAILKRKDVFIEKARIAGQIRKIEGFSNIDELRKHLLTLKHFKYIQISANKEPIADDQVPGSKEIVEALYKRRKELLAEKTEKRLTTSMADLLNKFKKAV